MMKLVSQIRKQIEFFNTEKSRRGDKPADAEEILSEILTAAPQPFELSSLLHELTVTDDLH